MLKQIRHQKTSEELQFSVLIVREKVVLLILIRKS